MHSSRMGTARSLIVSRRIPCTPPFATHGLLSMHAPLCHTCPPSPCTPPFTTHTPLHHACPPLLHMPPFTTHAPLHHAHPPSPCMRPFATHAPFHHACNPSPCTPPGNHARPPCLQTDTCKNITFANFVKN